MKVRILGVEPISLLQLVYNSRYFTTRQRRLRQCRNRIWYGIRKISSYSYPGSEIRPTLSTGCGNFYLYVGNSGNHTFER